MAKRDDIQAYNQIAHLLIDAGADYRRAADSAADPAAGEIINGVIAERRRLLDEMRARVRAMGGAPIRERGPEHPWMVKVRQMFSSRPKAAIDEVERGEDHLRDALRRLMRHEAISAEARAFFGVTLDQLLLGHDKVAALKRREDAKPPADTAKA